MESVKTRGVRSRHLNENEGNPQGLKSLQSLRKTHIQQVLEATGYDLENSARILAISRPELLRWMTKLEIQEPNGSSKFGL